MVVKTYRGLLADGGQDRIKLQTLQGKVGYRIIKFQAISSSPGTVAQESIIKAYKTSQTTPAATIDFAEGELLGVVLYHLSSSVQYPVAETIIFDNQIVNQDIYITHKNTDGDAPCNYYLELEVVPLSSDQAAITTVKAIRGLAED